MSSKSNYIQTKNTGRWMDCKHALAAYKRKAKAKRLVSKAARKANRKNK